MKILVTIAIALIFAQELRAQVLSPVLNPKVQVATLKEWWRADDKGYGVDGMTWLENFYNGEGALVISTPNGVQTWQLRYAWDTVNVFTWAGGSANIKVGDFNGDGVRDYLDGKGNLYVGRLASLPSPPRMFVKDASSISSVIDLNDDGIDDVLMFRNNYAKVDITLQSGDTSTTALYKESLKLGSFFDSSRTVVGVYSSANHKHRLIVRYAPFSYDSQGKAVYFRDEFELYDLKWVSTLAQINLSLIDHLNLAENYLAWQTGCIFQALDSSVYRIQAERLDPADRYYSKSNLVVYSLNQDKIKKIASARVDSVAFIVPSGGGIDSTDRNNLLVQKQNASTVDIYKGDFSSGLSLIGNVSFCRNVHVCLAQPQKSDLRGYLCAGGTQYISGDTYTCFSVCRVTDSISYAPDFICSPTLASMRVLPTPQLSNKDLELEIKTPSSGEYKLSVTNTLGTEVIINDQILLSEGVNDVSIALADRFVRGIYTLRLSGNKMAVQCPLIIE